MAAKKQLGIKLDEFVGAVRNDPAATEPLLFTSGYVGRSATDGHIRIYSDASLSRWVEAAEEDVVHSAPIADSPLGGSHLWLKASARLSPGAAGAPAPALPEPAQMQPFTLLGCTGFACRTPARAEPAFTEPPICRGETGHIPCENFTKFAARGWFTVHFCAVAQVAQPLAGTQWQSCACPSPSAGPWNC
jgi:hypothetical protein